MMRALIFVATIGLAPWVQAEGQDAPFSAHMDRAAQEMGRGDHQQAASAYRQALESARSDAEKAHAIWGLSRAHELAGDRREALNVLATALRLQPAEAADQAEARRANQWLLTCLQRLAQLAERDREHALAAEAHEQILRIFSVEAPEAAEAALGLARAERDAGRANRAIERLEQVLASGGESDWHHQARIMLAQMLTEEGRYEEALQVASAALPERRSQILVLIASASIDAGDYAAAAEAALAVLRDEPDHPQAARLLYRSAQRLGELDSLRGRLEREAAGEDGEAAVRLLAQIASWEDDPADALRWYRRLAELHPTDPDTLVRLGRAALLARELALAEQALRRARDLAPEHPEAANSLGELLVRQDRTDEAIDLFKHAVRYDPRNPSSVLSLTQTLGRHSLHHAAAGVVAEAREAVGDDALLAYELAGVFQQMLRYEDAAREYLRAIEAGEVPARAVGHQLERLATDEVAGKAVLSEIEAYLQRSVPSSEVRLALGRVLLSAGRGEQALELLSEVADASAEVAQLGREAELRGEDELALRLYRTSLGLGVPPGQTAEVALRMARLQEAQGDWREALQTLELVPALQEHPDALLMRARTLQSKARRLDDAEQAWRQLLAVAGGDPTYAGAAQEGLADWLFAVGNYDEAEKAWTEILAADARGSTPPDREFEMPPLPPGFSMPPQPLPELRGSDLPNEAADPARAMLRLAEIALRRGEFEQAEGRFRALLHRHPESDRARDALQWIAFMQENLGSGGHAEKLYLQALGMRERGEFAEAQILLIEVAGTRGEALADNALLLLGEIRAEAGEPKRAAETWLSLVERFPESLLAPEALLLAARVKHARLGEIEAAEALLRRIIDEHPQAALAHQARAELELLPGPRERQQANP